MQASYLGIWAVSSDTLATRRLCLFKLDTLPLVLKEEVGVCAVDTLGTELAKNGDFWSCVVAVACEMREMYSVA